MPNNDTSLITLDQRYILKRQMKYIKEIETFWSQIKTIGRDIFKTNSSKSLRILIGKILAGLSPLIQIYLIKLIIDQLTTKSTLDNRFFALILIFGAIQLLNNIISQFSSAWETGLQQEVSDQFANRIISKTSKLEYSVLEEPSFQNTLFLAQQQARFRVNQLLPALYNGFSSTISILFLVALFVGLKAYFFLVILVFALPISLNKWLMGKKTTDLEFKLAPKERESNYLFQVLTGLPWAKEKRTFDFNHNFQEQFQQLRAWIAREKYRIQLDGIKKGSIIETIEVAATIGIIYYLARNTINGYMGLGLFILYLQGIQRLQSSSKLFFQSLLQLFQLRIFLGDLYAFLALNERNCNSAEKEEQEINVLSIENLFFRYPHQHTDVLKNINLKARKGELIAIVGENGSGKSTLVKILAGLYHPYKGSIICDGDDSKLPIGTFLFQDFQQYQYNVENNIHFSLTPSENETKAAMTASSISMADEFVNKLSKGYQSNLGNLHEGSTQLSGGQWQKIALARIFYQKNNLVVLDEPSSALDAIAELNLYENIKKVLSDKMVILISHRLYNLKMADQIYVLQNGQIVDQGNFQELIARDGLFRSMYEKQKI